MSEPTGARRYGTGGGDAYYDAVKYGGYEGTREQFGKDQAEFAKNATAVAEAKEAVEQDTEEVRSTKETFVNTTVPDAIAAVQQEGADQVQAVTQQGEESSQQVEAVGTEQKDAVANEGRARVQAVEQAGTNQVQAVNDAGTTQVGNVNQAGEDQVDAVEQAGADQVQAVTDEGTTQVGAVTGEGDTQVQRVQDKGDEVIASIPADYTDLDQEVDNLKSALSSVVAIGTQEEYFAHNGDLTGTGISANIRWMLPDKVSVGADIKSIGFTVPDAYTSNNTPLVIEIFEVSSDVLTQVKQVSEVIPTSAAGTYVSFSIDYTTANPAYISFSQGRTMVTYTSGSGSMKYIRDTASATIDESSLSTFNGSLNIDVITEVSIVPYVKGDPSKNIVHIGEGYQYSEIQDALDSITDDSAANPYTFIIHPQKAPYNRFSTIRKLSDAYPWSNAPIRFISIIGMDRYHCIIEDNTGDYSTPPAEILVNGLIANLTFKATHTNQNPTARQGAYAVHIDAEPVDNVGYEMQFENCSFQSDQTAGVGIGLHNNSHLIFKNCEFISTALESYNPHTGYTNLAYTGSLNCHSSTNVNDTNQELSLINCVGISKEVRPYNITTTVDCYMTLKAFRNTFWCEGTSQPNGYKGSYVTLYGANHGNNSSQLNA